MAKKGVCSLLAPWDITLPWSFNCECGEDLTLSVDKFRREPTLSLGLFIDLILKGNLFQARGQGSGRRREETSKKRRRDSSGESYDTKRKSARISESPSRPSERKRNENDSRREENGRIKENWRRRSHRSEGRCESGQRKNSDSSQREERVKGRDRERSRRGCEDKNDAESKHFGRDAKTSVKSTQDFHSPTKSLISEDQTIRGGVGVKKMENNIEDEFPDLPDPVYACKPDCRCGLHY